MDVWINGCISESKDEWLGSYYKFMDPVAFYLNNIGLLMHKWIMIHNKYKDDSSSSGLKDWYNFVSQMKELFKKTIRNFNPPFMLL